MADDGDKATDEDTDKDDLTEDEKKEATENQIMEGADNALDRWHQNQTQEVREASIASYIESGEIDHEASGIDELEASIVQAGFAIQVERQVLKPVGLTLSQWHEHIADEDLPNFRRAVIEGRWQDLIDHARAAEKMRLDEGL